MLKIFNIGKPAPKVPFPSLCDPQKVMICSEASMDSCAAQRAESYVRGCMCVCIGNA